MTGYNVGHILTTLALVSGILVWGHKMDVRVALLEGAMLEQHITDARQDETTREITLRRDAQLNSIDSKLDRLIERDINR
jgi:hypothetical protein